MIRTLILLLPVYISLFWFISLRTNKKNISVPAAFLSNFMLICGLCLFGQYLFFAPYPAIFPYWEPVLAYLGSIAFPVYYIYFRLLTVDDHFSFRVHFKYLVVPLLIATVYTVGILLTPFEQYKAWLYNELLFPDSSQIQFLSVMRKVVKLTFVVLLVVTFVHNQKLLKKYAHKAEEYYADMHDGKFVNAKLLNYLLLFISISALVAHVLGRRLLLPSDLVINVIWLIFAVSLYGIGYMGFTQKAINPAYELDDNNFDDQVNQFVEEVKCEVNKAAESISTGPCDDDLTVSQQQILSKLVDAFERDKLFLNSNLNIMDVVQLVGTNRTYISAIINKKFNQNFCAYVNGYRLSELEREYLSNPSLSNEQLVEKCGFGSFNSMKRAIAYRTNLSVVEWKKSVLKNAVV